MTMEFNLNVSLICYFSINLLDFLNYAQEEFSTLLNQKSLRKYKQYISYIQNNSSLYNCLDGEDSP